MFIVTIIIKCSLFKHHLVQMVLSFGLQIEVPRDIWNKPCDEIGDDVNRELEHEHESEATSDHVPVLLVLLIRRRVVKVATVPVTQRTRNLQLELGKNTNDKTTYIGNKLLQTHRPSTKG